MVHVVMTFFLCASDYTAVTVTGCPQSASVYTEDLTAMLDWTAPTFTDSTMVAHNFMSATEGTGHISFNMLIY